MKKLLMLFMAMMLTFTLAACGSEEEKTTKSNKSGDGTAYPLTVKNFTKAEGGTEWKTKEYTYEKAPERIVATTRTAAEFLIHLGLEDKIVGVGGVFGTPDASVEAKFDKLPSLGENYISKEVALSADPDFIFGRGGLFDNADWGVGTVDDLNEMGIQTYVMESSVPGGTFDSIYKDIETIGKIFNVQDKAEEFAKELKDRQEKMANALSKISETKKFAYLHTIDPENLYVYSATTAKESFFNDMFKMLKLDNVFAKVEGDVSTETLIETNPDVLIGLHWNDEGQNATEQDSVNKVLNNPKLSSMQAVQNKQVFVADYNYLFCYSYQCLDGLEILAKQMYPDLF